MAAAGRRGVAEECVDGRNHRTKVYAYGKLLYYARADAARQVVCHEASGAKHVFYRRAEHPEGEHVEENVADVGVHEHERHELPHSEVLCRDVVEAKVFVEVYPQAAPHHYLRGEE